MRNKNQNGSAVVIVLVIIVIALLGALGYVFWKNGTKEDTKNSGVTSTTQQPATDKTKTDTTKYLTLKDWGVKMVAPESTTVTYSTANNEGQNIGIGFSTKDVEALGSTCVSSNAPLGLLTRSKDAPSSSGVSYGNTAIQLNGGAAIDGYYYMYTGPQGLCAEDGADVQVSQQKIVEKMAKTLQAE